MFIDELDAKLNSFNNKKSVIIIGDTNIDLMNDNVMTVRYLDSMSSNGLHCVVKEITREDIKLNTKTCIDHLFIRSHKANMRHKSNIRSAVITTSISDHRKNFNTMNLITIKSS